ncbi:hypothetical protein CLV78_101479 [Aliiruegeria haliotis]|uniref:DUF6854 domain-containing protein n=1 Tax=Aliiruegeria haliotis TaxID=1280846 RepID=A0A2T0RYY1_9RHOB|nr:hypothetical protein [Aliiruegeria haliotis]PRY26384.1 hypothetical protein CLV78_101479 [Aliiruegeria haliotis]
MADVNFMTATVAHVDSDYVDTAFGHCETIANDLRGSAAATARYGMLQTGDWTSHIIFLASYKTAADVEKGWDTIAASAGFRAMAADGKSQIKLRNVVRLSDVSIPVKASTGPGYGVITRLGSATPMVDEIRELLPIFIDNGAQILRYGTLVTGSAAGRRLMAVGYPSMAAIDATYEALMASEGYKSIMAQVELDFRNIVRLAG